MSERIEAAANQLRSQLNDFESRDVLMKKRARMVLKAADSVTFSDEAIERAAKTWHAQFLLDWEELPEWAREDARKTVRDIIAALTGDAA